MDIKQSVRNFGRLLLGKRMIIGKSRKELDKMRAAGELIASVREEVRRMVKPGVSTLELDQAAEKMIRDAGAIPAFKGYKAGDMSPFPGSICASVNHVVVHGIPSTQVVLEDGDIFSMDVAAILEGFVGDTATTIAVGSNVNESALQLIRVTEECLALAIEQCRVGKHVGDIGYVVQQHAQQHGYSVVKGFTGHGIGRKMHEDPQIPNYGKPGTKEKIRTGYVFAIEPMVNMGTDETEILSDGWTVITKDLQPSAHCEHTVAVTEDGPEILTLTKEQKAQRKQTIKVVETVNA